jgi:hypothetical protein
MFHSNGLRNEMACPQRANCSHAVGSSIGSLGVSCAECRIRRLRCERQRCRPSPLHHDVTMIVTFTMVVTTDVGVISAAESVTS